jgi:DNA-directed RNA polymerase specialized sigma24 family protein
VKDKDVLEDRLVLAVQRGGLKAFSHLIDLHLHRLRSFIALRAPVPYVIDKIAHDTFVYAYHNINRFLFRTSFFSWIQAIAENLLWAEVHRFNREQANQSNLRRVPSRRAGHGGIFLESRRSLIM